MAYLLNSSTEPPVTYELSGVTSIGRGVGCSIVVADPLASRRHAQVTLQADGGYVVEDLGSTHGTFVRGERVERLVLESGDAIVIGSTRLVFTEDPGVGVVVTLPETEEVRARGDGPVTTPPAAIGEDVPIVVEESEPYVRERAPIGEDHFAPAAEIDDEATLRRDYEKLRVAYELACALATTRDLSGILGAIIDTAFQLLSAERAAIFLIEPQSGRPVPYIARHRRGGNEQILVSRTIIDEVAASKTGMILADAAVDSRFESARSVIAQGIRSAMCVPMMNGPELMGIMHLDSLIATGVFQPADLSLFGTIASQGAMAIKNAALREQVQSAVDARADLARFLPPSLVDQVVSGRLALTGAAEVQEVTVLFSDVRGFTQMSENMEPREVLSVLNRYFEEMVEILFRHGGTLDKYVGDELMALFGAPVPLPNGPVSAVRCGLEMMAAMVRFNESSIAAGRPPLEIGIGIHTGPAVCGTLGSTKTMQYTAIGDTVNTGARLCSSARSWEIIVSQATREQLGSAVKLKELDPIRVKGKARPLVIYSALGMA